MPLNILNREMLPPGSHDTFFKTTIQYFGIQVLQFFRFDFVDTFVGTVYSAPHTVYIIGQRDDPKKKLLRPT